MKSQEILKNIFNIREIIKVENQNIDYEGIVFQDNKCVKYRSRLAKKTPKKDGYFVAFYERKNNINQAFNEQTSIDFLIILIVDDDKKGIFIIPKEECIKKGILSTSTSKGKMAMRFYPNWCHNLNNTALQTQKWQTIYFKNI
ncbi:MepB family protein [Arcobacter porcinus]|uniref:MepB family protein n=1 Tax=Arcobacter porcinus TaxID=1935204 RepID=UPI0009715339|nr:MepB family protein [Arcobacter porcinus]